LKTLKSISRNIRKKARKESFSDMAEKDANIKALQNTGEISRRKQHQDGWKIVTGSLFAFIFFLLLALTFTGKWLSTENSRAEGYKLKYERVLKRQSKLKRQVKTWKEIGLKSLKTTNEARKTIKEANLIIDGVYKELEKQGKTDVWYKVADRVEKRLK